MSTITKKQRKTTPTRNTKKQRNYTEKECSDWQCRVCREMYQPTVPYCFSCYQGLYYYCYVNAELFVEKDLTYLDIYYEEAQPVSESEEEVESEEEGTVEHPNLNWIDSLLE